MRSILSAFVLLALFCIATPAYAASRFWVGGTGTWDNVTTTHWAATSNGAGGASVPGSGDTVTFDANSGGGTVTPNYDMAISSLTVGAFTGTLDFSVNNNSPTMATFSNNSSGTRTIKLGSGTWSLSGCSGTVYTSASATNLTFDPGSSTIRLTGSCSTGTRTISPGTFAINNLSVVAGSDTLTLSSTFMLSGDLNLTGWTGTLTNSNKNIGGSLTFDASMPEQSGSGTWTFNGSGTNNTIDTKGVKLNMPITINGTGSWKLMSNLDMGLSSSPVTTRTLTLTQGGFDANGYDVTTYGFASANSNTRSLNVGIGTWTIKGTTGSVWNLSIATNLTMTGSSTITLTDTGSSALTFQGGGQTYGTVWFSRGSSTATTTITGSNTYILLKDDGTAAHGLAITAGTTQTVGDFQVTGSSGNLITLAPQAGSLSIFSLVKSGGGTVTTDYLDISHSVATPSSTWYPGAHSVNHQAALTAGSGWNFTLPTVSAVSVATTTNQATITWTTDVAASSRIFFGPSNRYGTSTPLFDSSPLVTSHTVVLPQLLACKVYHYKIESTDTLNNTSAPTDRTFITTGCPGSAPVKAQAVQDVTIASGGTLTQGNLTLTVPAAFSTATDTVAFQANVLDSSSYFNTISPPTGKSSVGSEVFSLTALSDATTTISSFDAPLTVTLSYNAGDVVDVDVSTLTIYRYDDPTWTALTGCSVDTTARTVTCQTSNFSDFSIFGTSNSSGSSGSSSDNGNGAPFAGPPSALPGYVAPRSQIVYPDGRVVYLDTPTNISPGLVLSKDLRVYDINANVLLLQQFLNAHGFTVSSAGPGSAGHETTMFGGKTYQAVIKYQKMKGLPATGFVGPLTRAQLAR